MKSALRASLAKHIDAAGLWVGLGMFVIVVALGLASTLALVNAARWVDHTHQVIESLESLSVGLADATSARRGFSLSMDEAELERYAIAVQNLRDAERRARFLTADNDDQQRRLDELEPLLARRIARLDQAIAFRKSDDFDPAQEAIQIQRASAGSTETRRVVSVLIAEEHRLLVLRDWSTAGRVRQIEILQVVGAVVGLTLILLVANRLRREIRRRQRSEAAIRESERSIQSLNDDLEDRVAKRTAELEVANRELVSFSYAVVHDLRAPLRGIGGFAEVLLEECEDTLSADARDALGEIQENARKMAILIDALVSMSRITRSELNRAPVDLAAAARTMAERLAADRSEPPVVFAVEGNLEADVDPVLASALVEILLENAWKFSAKAAAPRVDFGALETEGERVFFVRDTGAGFDMAHAAKLFTPFGRLHTASEFPGIGIGLAMAQRIVQRHGGRIWAHGEVGRGACFYFTIARISGGK
jgi:signal transduction histidine kinase